MTRSLALVPAALLALVACTPEFDPPSRIEKLRVVGIRSEPPEIDPTGVATLTSLVLRADFDAEPARTTTVLYLACIPTPGVEATNACVFLSQLADPGALLAQAAPASCPTGGGSAGPAGV